VRAKAVTAAAHKPIYAMLRKGEDFTGWGQGQFWERRRPQVFHKLAPRAKIMGMQLMLSEMPA